jgi:hypothetical protein
VDRKLYPLSHTEDRIRRCSKFCVAQTLFSIFIDSMLQELELVTPGSSLVHTDELMFVSDVPESRRRVAQSATDCIWRWSLSKDKSQSIENSFSLHCSRNNPRHAYKLGQDVMPVSLTFKDRSSNPT